MILAKNQNKLTVKKCLVAENSELTWKFELEFGTIV